MRKLADTSLPVTPQVVGQALEWLESVGRQQSWPARNLFTLRLCLDETLSNVAMHGFTEQQPAASPQVRLRLLQNDAQLALEICDNGASFDLRAQRPRARDATLEEAQIGGHGLRLLQHYLEDIRYERRDGWNQLTFITVLDDAG